ncbi:ANL family adenylate-forming protein [Mesotoga sp. UBA5847]|uniref:ANL family adenylate-forming protein n=1 Tax=Mesotoga sp. UBA5847 TaxID=1946859 RepID=UPI0025F287D8|nr:fatty acid--CoA ligase family protein [Mesotoga sp. UBA5847]
MNKFFWVDKQRAIAKTYGDLVGDLISVRAVPRFLNHDNPYELYVSLLASIVFSKNVDILDSDLSRTERENLGIGENHDYEMHFSETPEEIGSPQKLVNLVSSAAISWRLGIYTSGTTGRPKRIEHTMESLTRACKIDDRYSDSVWAFAYNPTHFAGLQVFFQAFLNLNTIVYVFETTPSKILPTMEESSVTHISATPTFYRSFVFTSEKVNEKVLGVTMGGEKFDTSLVERISSVFPNARIRNIYASSEAGSLFASTGDVFTIPSRFSGKVLIGDDGELLIHKSLLGISDDIILEGEWYHTGDVVERLDENTFTFISRKTEMINVGGYKVNPHEVEKAIREIEGVLDVRVFGRSNRVTGNIVVAEIVAKNAEEKPYIENEIGKLNKHLQSWKVPRIVNFVDSIEQTRTGKKVRK